MCKLSLLGLIPARGGSKGIPRKNVLGMAGKPLIAWTIDAALESRSIDSVVVSTDDLEIAEIAKRLGAEVPFLRPTELASDVSPTIDTVFHALSMLKQFDSVMLLQPTSPLRRHLDIDACVEYARKSESMSVVSVCDAEPNPFWCYTISMDNGLIPLFKSSDVNRRQDLPAAYSLNGSLYYAKVEWLKTSRKFIGPETRAFRMPREFSVDVDTMLDWRLAEILLSERQ